MEETWRCRCRYRRSSRRQLRTLTTTRVANRAQVRQARRRAAAEWPAIAADGPREWEPERRKRPLLLLLRPAARGKRADKPERTRISPSRETPKEWWESRI